MGASIIFEMQAIQFPEGIPHVSAWEGSTTLYLLLAQIGCSNVFDVSNRRARRWQAVAFGAHYEVIAEMTKIAADAAGGMLRLGGMRQTTPEAIIRQTRTRLTTAIFPEEARQRSVAVSGTVTLADGFQPSAHKREDFATLTARDSEPVTDRPVAHRRWTFDLLDRDELGRWLCCRSLEQESYPGGVRAPDVWRQIDLRPGPTLAA